MQKKNHSFYATVILIVVMEALFALIGALMPGPFTGTVTDAETNEPIANVSVSDGRNVVKTDENGAYTLPGYSKSRFVTVTRPRATGRKTITFRLQRIGKPMISGWTRARKPRRRIIPSCKFPIQKLAQRCCAWIEHVRDTVKETDPASSSTRAISAMRMA